MPRARLIALACLSVAAASPVRAQDRDLPGRPTVDPDRIVNESYGFRREREPTMTESEFALYEKVVPMITAQPEFALRLLEGMVGEQDSSAAFEFVLGNVYFEQRRYADAERHFKRAIEKFPTFIRAWDNLGVLHFTREDHAAAVPCFIKVISLGESEPRVLGLLGYCQLKSGHPLAAEASYLQAYSRDPDNVDWIEGLLSTYLETQQYGRAESLLRQLGRLKPDQGRFWLLLANVLLAQDRRIEAIAQLETALSLGVLDAEGMLILGDLHAGQHLFQDVLRLYAMAAEQQPELGLERMLRYARALTTEARFADAQRMLEAAEAHAGSREHAAVLLGRADLHQARGEWAQALALLKTVVDADPLNGGALFDLGRVEEELGNESRALIAYEAAARLDGSAYAALLRAANIHVRALRFDEALAAIERALALNRSAELLEFQARVRAMTPPEPR